MKLVLQPVSMRHRVTGIWQRGHDGSFPSHWFRFLGLGRTSYLALRVNSNPFPFLNDPSRQASGVQRFPILLTGPVLPVRLPLHTILPLPAAASLLLLVLFSGQVLLCGVPTCT